LHLLGFATHIPRHIRNSYAQVKFEL
jgi:hypothetical protein